VTDKMPATPPGVRMVCSASGLLSAKSQAYKTVGLTAVKNQWNGMVEWNTGMEYWNDL